MRSLLAVSKKAYGNTFLHLENLCKLSQYLMYLVSFSLAQHVEVAVGKYFISSVSGFRAGKSTISISNSRIEPLSLL